MTCELLLKNDGPDRRVSLLGASGWPEDSRAIDSEGSELKSSWRTALGSREPTGGPTLLPSGVPVAAVVRFEGVAHRVNALPLLVVGFRIEAGNYTVRFRDVRLYPPE
jgi:hypothetical protein